jgi:hypothetical protein
VTILKLDPEIPRRQNFDHSPLKLYVLFSSHYEGARGYSLGRRWSNREFTLLQCLIHWSLP